MTYIYLFRYGGLSFGSKVDISDKRSEHVSSIIQSLISINLTDLTLNKEHVKIWSTVMGLKTRFTTKNINKVSCHVKVLSTVMGLKIRFATKKYQQSKLSFTCHHGTCTRHLSLSLLVRLNKDSNHFSSYDI